MSIALIKTAVRARFFLTSRERASRQIKNSCDDYLSLEKTIPTDGGERHEIAFEPAIWISGVSWSADGRHVLATGKHLGVATNYSVTSAAS